MEIGNNITFEADGFVYTAKIVDAGYKENWKKRWFTIDIIESEEAN